MSIKINSSITDQEEILYDIFGHSLKEGTKVLVSGYKPGDGFLKGEISSITPKCIFVDTVYTMKIRGNKRHRRRVEKKYYEEQIINFETLEDLTNAEVNNS